MNDFPTNNTPPDLLDRTPTFFNETPTVAITLILAASGCYIHKTYTDAKYGRETKISHTTDEGFTYISKPVTANNSIICPA